MSIVAVDTNFIVSWLTSPPTELEKLKQAQVRALMALIYDNKIAAILSEVVLHETCCTLLGPRFPETKAGELCASLRKMIEWAGWVFEDRDRDIFTRALDILEQHPKLEFSDAVIAARAEAHGAQLATFDKRLAAVYEGPAWNTG